MKVALPLDKRAWHPSLLPGQIVLVSTLDGDGRPNVAPKSWVTMVAFAGPVVAFGCTAEHATYRNAVASGEFVVNVLPERLARRAWELADLHGERRLRACGLTPVPARAVRAPLVAECPAHLECELDDVKRYGDEALLFGRVVAASIDEECLRAPLDEQYARLAPTFFLEAGAYAPLGRPRAAADATPGRGREVHAVSVRVELDHVVVAVSDWERSTAFYRDVLGAEVVELDKGRVAFRFGARQLNVHGPGSTPEPRAAEPVRPGNSDVCFVWPGTPAAAVEHLRAHGVEPELGPVERLGARGRGTSVYFRDPDGSLLELIAYPAPR